MRRGRGGGLSCQTVTTVGLLPLPLLAVPPQALVFKNTRVVPPPCQAEALLEKGEAEMAGLDECMQPVEDKVRQGGAG